ncbi:hypothetical protein N7532_000743 [Penicillium argentinense]|uniref:Quinate/shikimate 5-dehydrogenase/glutamyl-tRNA reductase domain-containing protein n=1 Tax=Penicillium argentinense TaxID=1131581 RepID=A0A9W9G6A6_9EURO|nr:uncharacterized protein N7532_000743 [Penicillium argentinense]KAJ5112698.1 hypothetical protein N7532_000743 [Penicillium argentinense]
MLLVSAILLRNYPGILERSTGRPAFVIGGGGACRPAVYALWKWMGVNRICMVKREESEIRDIIASFIDVGLNGELVFVPSAAEAAILEPPVLVVGTVPDIPPKEPGEKVREITEVFLTSIEKGFVLEMSYHPAPDTYFFSRCHEMGWNVLYGTEVMIWQGVAQEVLWTELSIENLNVDEARKAVTGIIEKCAAELKL